MSEARFKEQKTPAYSVKGYVPQEGEWLSAQVYADRSIGLVTRIAMKFLAVRYSQKAPDGGTRATKYIYFSSADGKGLVLPEEDILSVKPAAIAPTLMKRVAASRGRA